MSARRPAASRPLLSRDTSPEAERCQIALWRAMSPGARLARAADASLAIGQLARLGARQRAPAGRGTQALDVATRRLGADLAARVYRQVRERASLEGAPMNPIDLVVLVARVLEGCGVRYVLGGSLASSISGEPRATLDVDLMVDLTGASVACVAAGLGEDFYVDTDALERAVHDRSSANVIHLPSATKIDMFVMGATILEPQQMDRRRRVALDQPAGASIYVYTPEDILLQKLRWFRLGGDVSDRQWRDVLGIVAVQGSRLDGAYLRAGASAIDVLSLLERALTETA